MDKKITRYWPLLTTLSLSVILVPFLFHRPIPLAVTLTIVLANTAIAIWLLVRTHWLAYRKGQMDRRTFQRRVIIDLVSLSLAMTAGITAAGWIGRMAGQAAFAASGQVWLAMLAGMLAGFAAGFAAGGLVRLLWRQLFSRRVAAAADPELPA